MKIAMIGHKRIPSREGGVEIVVEELATRLVKKGHRVDVYNRKGKNVQDKNADKENHRLKEYKGIKLITIPTINKKGIDALLYSFFATIRALFGKYDVIHYHAEGPCAMLWIPHLFGIKTVATIHGLDWQRSKWGGLATKYIKFGEKIAAKYADEIIVLSKNVQKYFKDTYNRETTFIPNGVNKPEIKEANIIKQKWKLEKDNYILFLARIVPEKGLHYLIKAYKQIDTDKKLVIAGGASHTNDYLEKIKDMVKDDDRIIMTGFVQGQELEELYSNCYLYCLPSDIEGMPISLLEAMSYGCNCLVSNIEENTHVTGKYATTFEKSNVIDLKEKIENILNKDEKPDKEKVSNYVVEKYNWRKTVDETSKMYLHNNDIIKSKKNFIAIFCLTISTIIYSICHKLINDNMFLLTIYMINYFISFLTILKLYDNNFLAPITLFFMFFSAFVGISPVACYLYGGILYKNQLILITLSLLSYIIAVFIERTFFKRESVEINQKQKENSDYIKYISYVLIAISLLGHGIYFVKNRTMLFGNDLENGRITALSGNGIIIQMMNLSTISICMLFELALNKKYDLKKVVIFLILFSTLSIFRGFRSAIIVPFMICLLMYNKHKKISNKTILIIGGCLLVIGSLLGIVRSVVSSSDVNIVASIMTTFKNGSINLNYILASFGSSIPFQHGYSYLINIKMLLPGPDMDFTLWLKDIMNIKFAGGGITPTIIGEFYLNFGTLGVYIGLFLLGLLMNKINAIYEKSNQIFYSSFLTYTMINIASGGIANMQVSLIITSVVYLILYFFEIPLKIQKSIRKLVKNEKK